MMSLMATNAGSSFTRTRASVLLDMMRGCAALLVLFSHWRNIFFIDFPAIKQFRALWFPFYGVTTSGHQAVVVFFVLSGYFVGGSVIRLWESHRWSWKRYALQRLVRLWVVLLPGLLLCTFWDRLGLTLGHAPALYGGTSGNHLMQNVAAASNWRVLLANALFLQGFRAPLYGSDTALWSLANEFWYYALFPLAYVAFRTSRWLLRIVCVALFLFLCWFVTPALLMPFAIWMIGVLLVWLPSPPLMSRWIRRLAALVLIGSVYYLPKNWATSDFLLGIVTGVCVWIFFSAKEAEEASYFTRLARSLSRFSFTLYVVHLPLLIFLASCLIGDGRLQPSLRTLGLSAGVLAVVLLYAWGVAWCTEFRTDVVRRWIEKHLNWSRPSRTSDHERAMASGT